MEREVKPPKEKPSHRTREGEQRWLNDRFVQGELSRDEWKKKTDELSDLGLWKSDGMVKKS